LKQINATSVISSIDIKEFQSKLNTDIVELQKKGCDVEIQYSTSSSSGYVVSTTFSALIIGRK
jgi:hypothetical protein